MKLARPDGELAISRAAAKYALCMGLSSHSNYPLEDVATQGTEQAEKVGYKALFLSVDVHVLGKRINEYRNEYTIPHDKSWPNTLSHGGDHPDRTEYNMFLLKS
ncbi:uncharacterized protein N7479_003545 [Penicillium vulpinum]|nr:uncharacterized protein N7479_003545 [Penicillium vulpinum]KAJ5963669.1 hypothetical protein N7479_003545 [Penicillium vulpinum]